MLPDGAGAAFAAAAAAFWFAAVDAPAAFAGPAAGAGVAAAAPESGGGRRRGAGRCGLQLRRLDCVRVVRGQREHLPDVDGPGVDTKSALDARLPQLACDLQVAVQLYVGELVVDDLELIST